MFKPIRHLLYTSLSSFLSIFFVPSLLCLVFFFILRLLYSNHSSLCLSFLPSLCFSLVFMPSPLLQAPPSCISFFFFIIVIIIFSSWSCFPSISFLLSHASSSIFLFFLLFLSSYSLLVPPHQQQQQQQLHYLSFKSCLFFFLTFDYLLGLLSFPVYNFLIHIVQICFFYLISLLKLFLLCLQLC